jgi:hypothetical protein
MLETQMLMDSRLRGNDDECLSRLDRTLALMLPDNRQISMHREHDQRDAG